MATRHRRDGGYVRQRNIQFARSALTTAPSRPPPKNIVSNFDNECRDAKRLTRRLERPYNYAVASRRAAAFAKVVVHSTVGPGDVAPAVSSAKEAWYTQRRLYCRGLEAFQIELGQVNLIRNYYYYYYFKFITLGNLNPEG